MPLDIGRPTDEAASSAEGDHLVIKKRAELHLQVAPLALLLLPDHNYKVWCHGGHGISYSSSCAQLQWHGPWHDTTYAIWSILRGHGRSWMFLVLETRKRFPKGCHLFGGDGKQAGTTTITDLQVSAPRVPPLTHVPNSSCTR